MFTFGILSSHLPYVAFVAVYLFYLLMPSQFTQLDETAQLNEEEKTIQIIFESSDYQDDNGSSTYFFTDQIAVATAPLPEIPFYCQQKPNFGYLGKHIPDKYILSSPFCRPPPAC